MAQVVSFLNFSANAMSGIVDALAKHLIPEIRCGIYNQCCISGPDHDTAAQAIVFRVWGCAYFAIATDHRHPTTGTCSKEANI